MPHMASAEIIIVWEEELIEAAKALEKAWCKEATKEDFTNALRACYAAIYSPKLASGKCPVTIMSAHKLLGKKE